MDVLKTAITVFVILFPVLMKAQQNLEGKASIFITLKLKLVIVDTTAAPALYIVGHDQ